MSSILALLRQQRRDLIAQPQSVRGIESGSGQVPPCTGDLSQLGVGHLRHFDLVVCRPEVEIGAGWHHERSAPNGAERCPHVAPEAGMCADVGRLPRREHRQQIVRVEAAEELLRRHERFLNTALHLRV